MAKKRYGFRAQLMIPEEWQRKLYAIAEGRCKGVAELMRDIIREWLDDYDRQKAIQDHFDNQGEQA